MLKVKKAILTTVLLCSNCTKQFKTLNLPVPNNETFQSRKKWSHLHGPILVPNLILHLYTTLKTLKDTTFTAPLLLKPVLKS